MRFYAVRDSAVPFNPAICHTRDHRGVNIEQDPECLDVSVPYQPPDVLVIRRQVDVGEYRDRTRSCTSERWMLKLAYHGRGVLVCGATTVVLGMDWLAAIADMQMPRGSIDATYPRHPRARRHTPHCMDQREGRGR